MLVKDLRLVESRFFLKLGKKMQDKVEADFKAEVKYKLDKESKELTVFFEVIVDHDDLPFYAKIVYGGKFELNNDETAEAIVSRLGKINCPAIMFPFIREHLASLTGKSNIDTMYLPPVNFVGKSNNCEQGVKQ